MPGSQQERELRRTCRALRASDPSLARKLRRMSDDELNAFELLLIDQLDGYDYERVNLQAIIAYRAAKPVERGLIPRRVYVEPGTRFVEAAQPTECGSAPDGQIYRLPRGAHSDRGCYRLSWAVLAPQGPR